MWQIPELYGEHHWTGGVLLNCLVLAGSADWLATGSGSKLTRSLSALSAHKHPWPGDFTDMDTDTDTD